MDWHALWARLEGAYVAGTLRCYRSHTASLRRRLPALRKAHALLKLPDPMAAGVNRLAPRGTCARPRQARGMTQHHLEASRNRAMLAAG